MPCTRSIVSTIYYNSSPSEQSFLNHFINLQMPLIKSGFSMIWHNFIKGSQLHAWKEHGLRRTHWYHLYLNCWKRYTLLNISYATNIKKKFLRSTGHHQIPHPGVLFHFSESVRKYYEVSCENAENSKRNSNILLLKSCIWLLWKILKLA